MVYARLYKYRHHAVLILRVVIGVIFVLHGLGKFGIFEGGGFGGAVGVFRQADLPAPYITAPILAVIETAGGLALIFGLLARAFAALLAIVVTVEIALIKLPQSLNPIGEDGYLFELTLLVGLIALAILGPGARALDE